MRNQELMNGIIQEAREGLDDLVLALENDKVVLATKIGLELERTIRRINQAIVGSFTSIEMIDYVYYGGNHE